MSGFDGEEAVRYYIGSQKIQGLHFGRNADVTPDLCTLMNRSIGFQPDNPDDGFPSISGQNVRNPDNIKARYTKDDGEYPWHDLS